MMSNCIRCSKTENLRNYKFRRTIPSSQKTEGKVKKKVKAKVCPNCKKIFTRWFIIDRLSIILILLSGMIFLPLSVISNIDFVFEDYNLNIVWKGLILGNVLTAASVILTIAAFVLHIWNIRVSKNNPSRFV